MNLFNFFNRKTSAPMARERLQILLAHERSPTGDTDLVTLLREEIIAVVTKRVQIDRDQVKVKMERGEKVSTLEVDIEIPLNAGMKSPKPAKAAKSAASGKAAA